MKFNTRVYSTGSIADKSIISLEVEKEVADTLKDVFKDGYFAMSCEPIKKSKSQDSFRYCWALINRIAKQLRVSKDEAYMKMLDLYAPSEVVKVLSKVDMKRFVKYFHFVKEVEENGKSLSYYKIYTPISEMTQEELNVFVDGVKSECKTLGINTDTPSTIGLVGGFY